MGSGGISGTWGGERWGLGRLSEGWGLINVVWGGKGGTWGGCRALCGEMGSGGAQMDSWRATVQSGGHSGV